jgi:hypothetical protein
VLVALPYGPEDEAAMADGTLGTTQTRRAAELVVAALEAGAGDREALLAAVRALGPFDPQGDPVEAPVWLWRAGSDWTLRPERDLPTGA